jgi:hypothetical protein
MIAFFYLKLAKNMPRVNAGVEAQQSYTWVNRVGLAINVILPLTEMVTWIWFSYIAFVEGNEGKKVVYAYLIDTLALYLAWIVSGTILVWAVFKIRSHINSAKNTPINIKTMVLHSSAFLLFMLSVIVLAVFYNLY